MAETVEELLDAEETEDREVKRARFELLSHASVLLEPFMIALGIVFLLLLLMQYAAIPLYVLGKDHLDDALQIIWAIFVVDFLLRLLIAPAKSAYLKSNWLIGLSLLVPFIRPLHVFRFLQALHGLSLLACLGAANRALRALRVVTRGRVTLYMTLVTVGVIVAGGVGAQHFDREYAQSPVNSLESALWWSATLVTTLNHELDVQSTEARLIAFVLRLYGLNVFCFFMASVASYLIGTNPSFSAERERKEAVEPAMQTELRYLRAEVHELRRLLSERELPGKNGV